ncbi:hypothetical protein K0M31_000588 [Melipona bicolor]|uniref:Uncharacterized protein n=1 Tax=Melipona bicolor TaxID=60889 RepID=A0AA40GE09_9HYME|nr:hypothetical protein K0M31_000588 [Melipona bicolor]
MIARRGTREKPGNKCFQAFLRSEAGLEIFERAWQTAGIAESGAVKRPRAGEYGKAWLVSGIRRKEASKEYSHSRYIPAFEYSKLPLRIRADNLSREMMDN